MKSAVAGTFDVLHDGHLALLKRAFEVGDSVAVGITSDEMASGNRSVIIPLEVRKAALMSFLVKQRKPWEIFEINDIFGPRDKMDGVDVLVLTEETLSNGKKLNEDRRNRGIPELEFSIVPLVMADDGSKISASAILDGKYGRDGKSDALDIVVGSINPVKVEAVRNVMEKIYGNVRITAVEVKTEVPEQPFEAETRRGAIRRAELALGPHQMAVGIEAGVFEREEGLFDIQYCAVLDSNGTVTVGMGPGFMYPDDIADLVRVGYTVSQAIEELYGESDIGRKKGAIGMLSNGLLDRRTLTEQAVTAAMIPRISSELGY